MGAMKAAAAKDATLTVDVLSKQKAGVLFVTKKMKVRPAPSPAHRSTQRLVTGFGGQVWRHCVYKSPCCSTRPYSTLSSPSPPDYTLIISPLSSLSQALVVKFYANKAAYVQEQQAITEAVRTRRHDCPIVIAIA